MSPFVRSPDYLMQMKKLSQAETGQLFSVAVTNLCAEDNYKYVSPWLGIARKQLFHASNKFFIKHWEFKNIAICVKTKAFHICSMQKEEDGGLRGPPVQEWSV